MVVRNKTFIKKVLERDNRICQCCGFKADEVHHIIPLALRGEDEMYNMITICNFCHRYAPDTKEEFEQYQKHGGVMIPFLIGIAMLKTDGKYFSEIMQIINCIKQIDLPLW